MGLLRLNKDATVTKLTLALFTEDLEDNKELGARVARLEAELAGAALRQNHKMDALHALVAAAGAHRVLGEFTQALSCLQRAAALDAGDAETQQMLAEAVADLKAKLAKAAPLAKKAPAKAEKTPEPKKEEPKAVKAEEPKKAEPEPEEKAEAEESEPKAEEPKAEEPKKRVRKCGTCGEEGHDSRTCEKALED